jgi:hypothetical protein
MFWRLFCPDRWVQKGREYQLDSFAPQVEPVTSALDDGREGVLFDLSIGRNKNLTARLGSAWYTRH